MIADWKLGMKMLRYAHGLKTNIVISIVMLVLDIFAILAGAMSKNMILGCYLLMCVGMLSTQLIWSLNASNMLLASPVRKRMQTSVPAMITCGNMMLMYLVCVLIYGGIALYRGELWASAGSELLLLVLMMDVIMVYLGVAYKYFTASLIFMCLVLPFMITGGFSGRSGGFVWGGQFSIPFALAIPAGFALVAAGGLVQYLISRFVYRTPLSKMALSAPLREEL